MAKNRKNKQKNDIRQTRTLEFSEIRAESTDDKRLLRGLASPVNTETVIGGWFREKFLPGAFTKTLQELDQVACWNHDHTKPLARKSTGTLKLWESSRGLEFEFEPSNTTWGNDCYTAVTRGDVNAMSILFSSVRETRVEANENEKLNLYEIAEAKLYEISPVTWAAYSGTEIDARALEMRGLTLNENNEIEILNENETPTSETPTTDEPGDIHPEQERSAPDDMNHSPAGGNDAKSEISSELSVIALRQKQLRLLEIKIQLQNTI